MRYTDILLYISIEDFNIFFLYFQCAIGTYVIFVARM